MATKIQEVSTTFRKTQSSYLKALRNESSSAYTLIDNSTNLTKLTEPYSSSSGTFDAALEDELDVNFSRSTLQQQQQLLSGNIQDVNIQQREKEITKIAQGIIELADIFRDMQNMVIDQGTLLDRIDYNIEIMHTNVKQADKELVRALDYQKWTQKCRIILLLSLIVFALFIILLVKPKRHSTTNNTTNSDTPPTADTNANTNANTDTGEMEKMYWI